MKRFSTIIIFVALFLTIGWNHALLSQKNPKDSFQFPKLNPIQIPAIQQKTLKNGLKLFLLEDHTVPTISLRGMIYVNSSLEPAEKIGLASITGKVLRTGGTRHLTGDQIDKELETMAASIETEIGIQSGEFDISMLKENQDRVLAILTEILRYPVFDQGKIDLAKITERARIARRNDDIMSIADREFPKLIYGAASPLARYPEYATIQSITREDILRFYQTYVLPDQIMIAVWGDFSSSQMIKKMESLLGDWKPSKKQHPSWPTPDASVPAQINFIPKNDVNQSHILLGHLGGLMSQDDYPALALMSTILSLDRMFKVIRSNEGLSYMVWGDFGVGMAVPGVFSAGAQTKSESTVKAIQLMWKEIQRICETEVTDEELKIAKDQFLNSYVFRFDSREKIIERMLTQAFYGYPLDFTQTFFEKIQKITKADILTAARKNLKPGQIRILVIGKAEDFDQPLSTLGQVNTIDITIPPLLQESQKKSTPESTSKGKEILEKALGAIGEKEKVTAVKSLRYKMKLKQKTPMGEMAVDAEFTIQFPDKIHISMQTPMGPVSLIVNGEKGWIKSPQGNMAMPDEERKDTLKSLYQNLIFIAQDSQRYQVQLIGLKTVREKEVFDLLLKGPDDPFHLYIDQASFDVIGTLSQGLSVKGPASIETVENDFRSIEGIRFSFKQESSADGEKVGETEIQEIKINPSPAEDLFHVE